MPDWGRLLGAVVREVPRVLREVQKARAPQRSAPQRPARQARQGRQGRQGRQARVSPDAPGGRHLSYAPQPDGRADPGEIVWTWVPYEEDASQGKDRPLLVVGREGRDLVGLMLSSNAERDGQHGWYALGTGPWDREQRPSFLRLDRVIDVDEDGIRREGAVLDRERFDAVAARLRQDYGWR